MSDSLATEDLMQSTAESGQVDFKGHFDVENEGEWLEIIKDMVAMANSGGGLIIFGLHDDGSPSSFEAERLLTFDTANITAKVRKWTSFDLPGVTWLDSKRDEKRVAALKIDGLESPVPFVKDGQYTVNEHTKFAFRAGQFFFRHGAKSEPGSAHDISASIERRLQVVREEWLGNIRKVVEAKPGSTVQVVRPTDEDPNVVQGVRLVNDNSGIAHKLIHPDVTHPLRQCDVIRRVNERLQGAMRINQAHVQDIRRVHNIDSKPTFYFKGTLRGALTQYSEAFVDWIVENFTKNPDFFDQARDARRALTMARNDARSEKLKAQQTLEMGVL
ncbi:MAG: putative DNA binding domain-containing protein [Methylacidiphilales bacterium]|nr:putative DNA binding domain-containing protein [Candidatus Methylacidiphilales bacterium]